MRLLRPAGHGATLRLLQDREHVEKLLVEAGVRDGALALGTDYIVRCAGSLAEGGWSPAARAFGFRVPGRIEILGKHTDYGGGRSLVTAAEQGFSLVAVPRPDAVLRLVDLQRGVEARLALDPELPAGTGWTVYPAAVARRTARNFPEARTGADIVFWSDLPAAAGLSSSSALVVALFAAVASVNSLAASESFRENIAGPEDLAAYLGSVENGRSFRGLAGDVGVGTQGGAQDHTAIVCSCPGAAVQYRWAPVRLERTAALPAGYRFVVASSGVRAKKTGDAMERYNLAAELLRAVEEIWRARGGGTHGGLGAVADAGGEAVEGVRRLLRRAEHGRFTPEMLVARFDHFAAEAGEIVPSAGAALERGDLAEFGALVDRSQALAERLLGNQVEETAALARLAREEGAAAASAFGAGFGGSVWALIRAGEAVEFEERWRSAYRARFPEREAAALWVHTVAGTPAVRLS